MWLFGWCIFTAQAAPGFKGKLKALQSAHSAGLISRTEFEEAKKDIVKNFIGQNVDFQRED